MSTLALDPKFIQVATPILSEFGFSGVKELVTEQLMLMYTTFRDITEFRHDNGTVVGEQITYQEGGTSGNTIA